MIIAKLKCGSAPNSIVEWVNYLEGMVIQLGLSASLLAGRIAETPLPQLPPGPG